MPLKYATRFRTINPIRVDARRADMDALPVEEQVDLPFKSRVEAVYRAQTVSVMHACGHDTHVAMLMGTPEVLASLIASLPGTVKFIADDGLKC
jgi:amidohydrolase